MATVVAAMAALAVAVTAALAALHLKNISPHHSTDPRTAENALIHSYIFPKYYPYRIPGVSLITIPGVSIHIHLLFIS